MPAILCVAYGQDVQEGSEQLGQLSVAQDEQRQAQELGLLTPLA